MQKALQELGDEVKQTSRAAASHSTTFLKPLIFFSERNFSGSTKKQKIPKCWWFLLPCLGYFGCLALSPERESAQARSPLGPGILNEATQDRRLRLSKKTGRSRSRVPAPTAGCLVWVPQEVFNSLRARRGSTDHASTRLALYGALHPSPPEASRSLHSSVPF